MSSCSVARLQTDDSNQLYSPTIFENIEVYSSEKTVKTYIVIGEVIACAEAFDDGSNSVKNLKKEAAKLGADGIVNLRLEIDHGFPGSPARNSGIHYLYIAVA